MLVLDKFTHDIIAPLVTLKDLRDHGVTLHLKLQQDREEISTLRCTLSRRRPRT